MKKKTPQQYDAMVQKASPHSPVLKNCLFAFLSGGAICTLGQALANTFMLLGLDLKDARTCVSISLIFISAALTAYGVYDNIAKYAGAGTLVPITGFANSMVSPALEFKSEGPRREAVHGGGAGTGVRHFGFGFVRDRAVYHRAVLRRAYEKTRTLHAFI